MKVMLLNDTGILPHVGCQAVADGHARLLGAAGHEVVHRHFVGRLGHLFTGDEAGSIRRVLDDPDLARQIGEVDAVVVNGEGTIHHGHGRHYLAILGAAQELGRRTLLVNAVFEDSDGFEGVLARLDDFCVRDARSARFAASRGANPRIVPDSFLAGRFDPPGEAIDLAGRVIVTDWHPVRDGDVGAALRGLLAGDRDRYLYFPLFHGLHTVAWRSVPSLVASAEAVVTARHHGIYLAAQVRRPFVALPSNTFKVEGLIEWSGLPIPVCTARHEVEAALRFCRDNPQVFEEFFAFLDSHRPLTTFAALGTGDAAPDPERELARLARDVAAARPPRPPAIWGLLNDGPGAVTSGG